MFYILFFILSVINAAEDLTKYVNIDIGTNSTFEFSRGNLLPIVSHSPFAMNHFAEMTSNSRGPWWYHPHDKTSGGILLNHQPSPWIDNYAFILFGPPQVGERMNSWRNIFSFVNPYTKVKEVNEIGIEFMRYQTRMSITPSKRGGIVKVQWPKYDASLVHNQDRRFVLMIQDGYVSVKDGVLTGYTSKNSGGVPKNGMKFHFRIETGLGSDCIRGISKDVLKQPAFDNAEYQQKFGSKLENDMWLAYYIELDPEKSPDEMYFKFGTSFISEEQAKITLDREVGSKDYNSLKAESTKAWNDALSRVLIPDSSQAEKEKFYSILYRGLLFPRDLSEYDKSGKQYHWSPYDPNGGVFPGPLTVDQGFWDAYRTSYSFWSIAFPDLMSEMMDGWFSSCLEGGWYPRWSSPGYRTCMPATASNVVVSDAVLKGIGTFDKKKAYECLRKDAFVTSEDPSVGRMGIKEYIQYGYVPSNHFEESVSRTLSFGFEDFALAQMAKQLGEEGDYNTLFNRSKIAYQSLFHSGSKFFVGKSSHGTFDEVDPFQYGSPYTEGNAWQFSLSVPHDIPGVAKLHGGNEEVVKLLDQIMKLNHGEFRVGQYGNEIHEMAENSQLSLDGYGQLGFNNQPGHHLLFVYSKVGAPEKTQYWTQRIYNELYTRSDFPGDEDNGEMALWGVLSSIGVYQLTPSTNEYILTTPVFPKIQIQRGNSKSMLTIERSGSAADVYIDHVTVDGKRLDSFPTISYQTLMNCTSIVFHTKS